MNDLACILASLLTLVLQVILDIPDSGAYYVFDGDNITTETMSTFIEDYDEERLERKELQEDAEAGDGEAND